MLSTGSPPSPVAGAADGEGRDQRLGRSCLLQKDGRPDRFPGAKEIREKLEKQRVNGGKKKEERTSSLVPHSHPT
jgi:hypothetical protein